MRYTGASTNVLLVDLNCYPGVLVSHEAPKGPLAKGNEQINRLIPPEVFGLVHMHETPTVPVM